MKQNNSGCFTAAVVGMSRFIVLFAWLPARSHLMQHFMAHGSFHVSVLWSCPSPR